ncbi:VOC family protein [Paenibacillus sp. GCM10027627]|uniref:VOC family protein n=1 Tax=unclassified Paenibacillus TaxID=185978 RepID=UPI00363616D3
MGKLKPYLISTDARTQGEFYTVALEGEIVSVLTHEEAMGAQHEFKDKVMHMCISVAGNNNIFLADAFEPVVQGTCISLSIEYEREAEAAAVFAKLADGGQIKHPFELQPFGIYYGELLDRFGVSWMITAPAPAKP